MQSHITFLTILITAIFSTKTKINRLYLILARRSMKDKCGFEPLQVNGWRSEPETDFSLILLRRVMQDEIWPWSSKDGRTEPNPSLYLILLKRLMESETRLDCVFGSLKKVNWRPFRFMFVFNSLKKIDSIRFQSKLHPFLLQVTVLSRRSTTPAGAVVSTKRGLIRFCFSFWFVISEQNRLTDIIVFCVTSIENFIDCFSAQKQTCSLE